MMKSFQVEETNLSGLKIIKRSKISDKRGSLSRLFCFNELSNYGWDIPISQINHTHTQKKATIRGMHFQKKPYREIKLVTCLKGAVMDIAVDIRSESKTFLKYFSIELNQENEKSLLIPEGFAHGFQTLTDDVELLYFHSKPYSPEYEDGLNPLDDKLNINWPLPQDLISNKDRNREFLKSDYKGI